MILKMKNRILYKIRSLRFYIRENFKHVFFTNKIYIGGFSHSKNFGDHLNYYLTEYLSEKRVVQSSFVKFKITDKLYFSIGSILQWVTCSNRCAVWGAGFIGENESLKSADTIDFHAVRGPLSRSKVSKYVNNELPIGDPVLLMPLLFSPIVNKKYKIGIIPHYVDKNNEWIIKVSGLEGVIVLDIECGKNWKDFIKDVLSCDKILSSSLHGLIIADSYGIPSDWIILSNKVKGGDFKFLDYYYSIGNFNPNKINISPETPLSDLQQIQSNPEPIIDRISLINSCPFITERKRNELIQKNNV